jgi:hypothetical protein
LAVSLHVQISLRNQFEKTAGAFGRKIPKLETYLDEYIAAAGIAGDKDGPLFRTTGARPARHSG